MSDSWARFARDLVTILDESTSELAVSAYRLGLRRGIQGDGDTTLPDWLVQKLKGDPFLRRRLERSFKDGYGEGLEIVRGGDFTPRVKPKVKLSARAELLERVLNPTNYALSKNPWLYEIFRASAEDPKAPLDVKRKFKATFG